MRCFIKGAAARLPGGTKDQMGAAIHSTARLNLVS
jgi:hypothetical protein